MRIWIDLGNSPHVPFFSAIAGEFEKSGHSVVWTARDYAQTVELAESAGLEAPVFGSHGGKSIAGKGLKFGGRILSLAKWAFRKKIDLTVSHNSHEPLVVSRVLRIPSVNLMDYEHHPANHLSFRMAGRVIVPVSFPDESLRSFGALTKTEKYDGIKEDVYLADFEPDPDFCKALEILGIGADHILIVVRPHANEALYNRKFPNALLEKVLENLKLRENVRVVLLPRKRDDSAELHSHYSGSNVIIPDRAIDGANLLYSADLVVSGGGTMNREAAALGTPTATIFTGRPAAIDDYLMRENRMRRIGSIEDLDRFGLINKKSKNVLRGKTGLKKEIAAMILEGAGLDKQPG